MISIKKILVPVDFSETSLYAAKYAASLARAHQASLFVLHVKEPFPVHGRILAGSLEDVQEYCIQKEKTRLCKVIPENLKKSIAVKEIQVTGMPVHRVIVEMAGKLKVDVIVTAFQDRKGFLRSFKKDIIELIIRDAPCSVFVVRK
jgi:nucleotide-binding universal stress UspA family protein